MRLACKLYASESDSLVAMQDEQALEAQKVEQWVPKVGSMIFVPRMKGNFKVSIDTSSISETLISFSTQRCLNFAICLCAFNISPTLVISFH